MASICYYGHKRVPSREGGVEVVVEELAVRMAAMGHDVTCYNRRRRKDVKKVSYKGVTIKSVPTIDRRGMAAVTGSFFAAIRAAFGRYDIVHIHAEGPAFMCWLPKFMGKRVIVTIHGLDHRRAKWGRLASAFIMMGEKNAVKYADEVIVLSRGVEQYFEDTYKRKTIYIPNGVSRPQRREASLITDKFGLEKDSYILYLGRLVPEKGVEHLVSAYRKLKSAGNYKLVIAGGSSDTDEFTEKLKKEAADDKNIIFTGFVQGKLLEELYSNAYVYVLPSELEGMPLGLLEAMSYGNCCLTSDIAENSDVTGEHGITFMTNDDDDLAAKLQMLADNPDMVQKYKREAADYICAKYNWEDVAKRTLEVYLGEQTIK